MRVLVIEDDQETANFLKRALKEPATSPNMPATARPGSSSPEPTPTTC